MVCLPGSVAEVDLSKCSSSAPQDRLGGVNAPAERLSDLANRHLIEVTHHKGRPLYRWQLTEHLDDTSQWWIRTERRRPSYGL